MVTVSLCKKGEKTRYACATVVKPPHSLSRLNHGSAAQTQLSNPIKQKIIQLCSFVNLGWTYKLHICWFIVVDVPVAGVHCVEDHINGLTHLFFYIGKRLGFGKRPPKRTSGTQASMHAMKKVDFYGSNRGGTNSGPRVCAAGCPVMATGLELQWVWQQTRQLALKPPQILLPTSRRF